jgi:hypothetical protein
MLKATSVTASPSKTTSRGQLPTSRRIPGARGQLRSSETLAAYETWSKASIPDRPDCPRRLATGAKCKKGAIFQVTFTSDEEAILELFCRFKTARLELRHMLQSNLGPVEREAAIRSLMKLRILNPDSRPGGPAWLTDPKGLRILRARCPNDFPI